MRTSDLIVGVGKNNDSSPLCVFVCVCECAIQVTRSSVGITETHASCVSVNEVCAHTIVPVTCACV